MFEKVEVVEPEELNFDEVFEPYGLTLDIDEEIPAYVNLPEYTRDSSLDDPFAYFCSFSQSFFDLEGFTILLLQEIGIFSKEEMRSRPFFDNSPEFWLMASIVEMVGKDFPLKERVVETLATMLEHMEIRVEDPGFKNAVDLMFDDLIAEEGKEYRACALYGRFKKLQLPLQKSIIEICLASLRNVFPKGKTFDNRENVHRRCREYIHPSKDAQGNLLRSAALLLIQEDRLMKKVAFRMGSGNCKCLQYPILWAIRYKQRCTWITSSFTYIATAIPSSTNVA